MDMCYDGTLVMPSSYVLMDEEEMMYVEGGIAIPNWVVSGAVNVGICVALGGVGTALTGSAIKTLEKASARVFCTALKKKLIALGVAQYVAGRACQIIPTVLTFVAGVCDPGGAVARYLDRHDSNAGNGYWDL